MSIGARLILLILLATLAPALLIGAYFYQMRGAEIGGVKRELSSLTRLLSIDLDGDVSAALQLVELLAGAAAINGSDPGACSALLADIVQKYPRYSGALVIPISGAITCASNPKVVGGHLSERDYVRAALATSETIISDVRIGEITGIPVLPIARAVRDDNGTAKFVLVATLNLARVAQAMMQVAPFKDRALLVVNDAGTIVARQPKLDGIVGTSIKGTPAFQLFSGADAEQTPVLPDVDGTVRIWSVRPAVQYNGFKLTLALGVSEQEIVGAANGRLIQALTVLAVLAALLFAAALFISRVSIQRPIRRISAFIGQLGGGNTAARITGPLPAGELGGLMKALNSTAESLETHLRELEEVREQLLQSSKIEAIGQLTGGIAHDLNNILTVIMGNIDVIKSVASSSASGPNHDLVLSAALVRRASERGAELTKSLLAYARKQPLRPRPVDVNELVRETDRLLRHTLGEHIDIKTVLTERIDPAFLDPTYLQNALINLALNARDAMPEGGKLTIETGNVVLDEAYASQHLEVHAGPYVMLAVTDTGTGIAPEMKDRVFEPFFTTKEKGKGSGLGLSMVYGFVKQSDGHVKIYSELGAGTTIKMYFPKAGSAAVRTVSAVEGDTMPRGHETILVVEDDPLVRESVLQQLSDLGYTATAASSGRQALAILGERQNIDLLFTDVVLPGGMNGRVLADEARRGQPGLKVLYTSGYTENAIIHQGRVDRDIVLLTKPYSKSDLAKILRVALAGSSPEAGVG